ncbi:MAG: hypothetical protein CMB61_03735 [Euryarchaeota archaeon]|nr:hypothetical protein [Euryarchaeota archaeon]
MVVPRLIIITGTSGVGKSTMSAKLASSLGFSKTAATDTIREVLRMSFSREERPSLHRSSFENAGNSAKEDWMETIEAVSEGIDAVINRAKTKGTDLLLEGVHYFPNNEIIETWKESGGVAVGVVLYITSEDRHRGMIANREKHNGKRIDHYLENLDRIREIQDELVVAGTKSDWILVDPTRESDAISIIRNGL